MIQANIIEYNIMSYGEVSYIPRSKQKLVSRFNLTTQCSKVGDPVSYKPGVR